MPRAVPHDRGWIAQSAIGDGVNRAVCRTVEAAMPSGYYHRASAFADSAGVAQWQSTAFVKRGLRVRIPPSAFVRFCRFITPLEPRRLFALPWSAAAQVID